MKKIIIGLFCICFFCAWNGWNGHVSRPYVRQSILTGYTDITTNMTADNLPAPLATSADSYAAGYEAYCAFDGVTNSSADYWYSGSGPTSNHWIKYDWGTNRTEIVSKYTVQASSNALANNRGRWTSWQLFGSNPAASRVLLDTQVEQFQWTPGQIRAYAIGNTTAYRYYLLETVGTNAAYEVAACSEVRWFESVWE